MTMTRLPWFPIVVVSILLSQLWSVHGWISQLPPLVESSSHRRTCLAAMRRVETKDVNVGDLLSDLKTPSLLIELSLLEAAVEESGDHSLDDILKDLSKFDEVSLDGALFVHATVTNTDERDAITQEFGSGKSAVIGSLDVPTTWIPGGAYLGIGLANHHVGGYYWARGMGMGASLPAHGVEFGESEGNSNEGFLYWRKRGPGLNALETTEESSNSNDGKRSEWADFLVVGDTVQLIPNNAKETLRISPFELLIGVRRIGRPLGADPIVEKIWQKSTDSSSQWIPRY